MKNDKDKDVQVTKRELGLGENRILLKEDCSHALEKKLIRKVDFRLLPILGALYAISQIDRVNVGARIFPCCDNPDVNSKIWSLPLTIAQDSERSHRGHG